MGGMGLPPPMLPTTRCSRSPALQSRARCFERRFCVPPFVGVPYPPLKLGTGKTIKTGKLIEVTYVGRFDDSKGKVFDRSMGKGFQFRLGRKEVIKGWDLGLRGMRVGWKRRLIVPPAAGYGANRYENIPGGSTLCFDVQVERAQE